MAGSAGHEVIAIYYNRKVNACQEGNRFFFTLFERRMPGPAAAFLTTFQGLTVSAHGTPCRYEEVP
jgi:hypothetical protein